MAAGQLRAVVATSSLDLGIDWAAVDLVIQVGAPKGVSRLVQRVGRSNHRMDVPCRAILVPANRFEVLECGAALDAIRDGSLDGDPPQPGGLDVLAQHVMAMACAGPFRPDDLYREVTCAAPYADLPRKDFDDVRRLRRAWRLCARATTSAGGGSSDWPTGACKARLAQGGAAAAHEHRHHRRGAHAEGEDTGRRRCWARWRNISRSAWRKATPSSSRARCCATCRSAR